MTLSPNMGAMMRPKEKTRGFDNDYNNLTKKNVVTICEHNDDDTDNGMAVMMIMTNVRKSGFE